MLDSNEQITFVPELIATVQEFLDVYEERKGDLRNDLERGLVISYLLGIMRCELDAVWDRLGKTDVFGGLHPRVVFEECVERDAEAMTQRRALIEEELSRRGWLSDSEAEAVSSG